MRILKPKMHQRQRDQQKYYLFLIVTGIIIFLLTYFCTLQIATYFHDVHGNNAFANGGITGSFQRVPYHCYLWGDTSADSWWTTHPQWEISIESETGFCFQPITNNKKSIIFQNLFDIGFKGDCSNVATLIMWNSGYGSDFKNIEWGLKFGLQNNRPFQIYTRGPGWHYAVNKDGSHATCKTKDMFCYFLKCSSCHANPAKLTDIGEDFLDLEYDQWEGNQESKWILEWISRPKQWLRKEVFDFTQAFLKEMKTPCLAMHVRRTDVILHDDQSRKYHAIKEYLDAVEANNITIPRNILLFTDDQNAIEEAETLYPEKNWMYLNRPRYRGAEGGWENQIPSNVPKQELIFLLSSFKIVRQCSTFVYGFGRLSFLLADFMDDDAIKINFDRGRIPLNADNVQTADISKSFRNIA